MKSKLLSLAVFLAAYPVGAETFVSAHGRADVTGAVDFRATIVPEGQLALEARDLGGGLMAYTAEYQEHHTLEMRHERREVFAYADGPVSSVMFAGLGL